MFDLAEAHPGFTDVNARDAWLRDPVLVPTRETVERIASARDWVEILVATNLVFEPLVGELMKTEFLSRNAVHNGDPVTPLVLASVRADTRRHLAATRALASLLLDDPEHSTHNRTVLNSWVARWGSESQHAAEALAPLFAIDKTVTGQPFDRCWLRVRSGWHALVEEGGLEP